jgi:hypothetical protein
VKTQEERSCEVNFQALTKARQRLTKDTKSFHTVWIVCATARLRPPDKGYGFCDERGSGHLHSISYWSISPEPSPVNANPDLRSADRLLNHSQPMNLILSE